MTLNFTNNENNAFTLSTNSNELKFIYKNKDLCKIESNSENNLSKFIVEYENIAVDDKIQITLYGKIEYINLEGGFYGIITDANEKYIPINLQDKLKNYVNHNISIIESYAKKDQVSIYMWGKLLYVESYGIMIVD